MIFVLLTLVGHIIYSEGGLSGVPGFSIQPSDNAELYCLSDATPKPRTIQWFKEGKELKTTPGQYDIKQNTESLEVVHIDEADVGEYTCVDKGNGDTAHPILNAGAWSENNKDMVKNQGDTITVDCHAWGHPTPEITWFKDGKALTIDGSHYRLENKQTVLAKVTLLNGRLIISKSKASDTGKYKCVASNPTGAHAASTSVRIRDPLSYLWPILGILLLLILLGVGIGLFLYFRNKYKKSDKKRKAKWKKMEAEKKKQMQQVVITK